jgi:regulator of sigma E protease
LQVARGSLELLTILPSIFLHPQALSGVVGIVAAGKSLVGTGIADALRFAVLLNLNLAIFNLLPILPLDGGKIVFCTFEKLVPRAATVQRGLTLVGLAALLLLMAYTTVLDVIRQLA